MHLVICVQIIIHVSITKCHIAEWRKKSGNTSDWDLMRRKQRRSEKGKGRDDAHWAKRCNKVSGGGDSLSRMPFDSGCPSTITGMVPSIPWLIPITVYEYLLNGYYPRDTTDQLGGRQTQQTTITVMMSLRDVIC